MLSLMRKHAGSWIIKFILGAIILAFIPFGYGIYRDQRDTAVASVNGEAIYYQEFSRLYGNLVDQVRRNFGNSVDEETLKGLRLKQQALDQLIDQRLMLEEAKRLGLSVSAQELAQSIAGIEVFQTAGVFDSKRYAYVLDRFRLSQEEFEAQQKAALLTEKLREFMTVNIKVAPEEALEWYRWNQASTDLRFVIFHRAKQPATKLSETELQAYFDEHKERYRTETEVKVRYLRFSPAEYMDRVNLTEEEIRDYYESHPDEFQTPKTVEARHILFSVDQGADEQAVEEALQKARQVLEQARAGADFAELARKYSEGPTAQNGGYLGTFTREAMVKPFSDRAFAMAAGEISDPVRTRFGWHIIKVEKVNEAATTPYEDAREGIRAKLSNERAKALAYEAAEQVYENSFQGEDLVRNAAERGLRLLETDYFKARGPQAGVTDPAKFATAAFSLEPMEIGAVTELSDGYYILQATDIKEPRMPEFAEVEQRVQADLADVKQGEKASGAAEIFLAALREGKPMAAEAERLGLQMETTGYFKRNSPVPKIGFNPDLVAAAFRLSEKSPLPETVFEVDGNYVVIEFSGRKEPSESDFQNEKVAVSERLLQQKRFKTLTDWIAELRNRSEIKIEQRYLE